MPIVIANGRRALGLIFAVLLLATSAVDAAAEETGSDDWQFIIKVYGWMADIGGTTGGGEDIDTPFSDIWNNLKFGGMGAAAARKGKWTLFSDAIYLHLEADDSSTADVIGMPIETSVDVGLKGFISTTGASYAVIENDSTRINLLAGGRYLWLDLDLDVEIGPISGKTSETFSVIDGVVGFRGRTKIAERWHIAYYADVGTGESDITWQLSGSLDYRLKNVDLVLGYRYLGWDFDSDDSDLLDDVNFSGPYVGVRFTL